MGQLIKYTDKAFLREHPFGDPLVDAPAFVQKHSYIFPGDEIVLYHKLSLPGDGEASDISQIKLISAKASVIAQKPQVFSEEFSFEFQSTRNFELDSFITPFNNSNAKVILWGADGYAPRINLQQDRNWKLPDADFRRQINFFTKHTGGILSWDYYFYFPILFRWEYWKELLTANDDFFDDTQPENGQNEWWYHYFVANKWRIVSRLEVRMLVSGQLKVIRSELNLTPNTSGPDVNDYNSNTDWINKSIKTGKVGQTLYSAPAFIYGNKNTEVRAFFEKNTDFAPSEQTEIAAVMWIEPYLGAGVPARTRGSSLYPVGDETVFLGIDATIEDDEDVLFQDDDGNFIVTDTNGNGVLILFNGTEPRKVQFLGIIDYNKLNRIYPGIKEFMLYARLYNTTVGSLRLGAGESGPKLYTRRGEEIRQKLVLVAPPDSNALCNMREPECPFNLHVFADPIESDNLKNDKSDFYQYADAYIAAIKFTLQKNSSLCGDENWTDVKDIVDSSYGGFFAYGKSNDFKGTDFEDDYGKKYTGVLLEWRKVLLDETLGEGMYRMKITKTDAFGNAAVSYDVRTFCLKNYNCNFTNRTIRIDYTNIGLRGTLNDPSVYIDYMNGWKGQIRLKGILVYNGSGYDKEYNQYDDSQFNAYRPVTNQQNPKYILSIRPIPGWMDFFLSTDVLQSDIMLLTDYNTSNRHKFINLPVMNDGEFKPEDYKLANPLSDVKINLAYGQNNLRVRNS